MSGREAILGKLRRAMRVSGEEADRRETVAERLDSAPQGIIPERGQRPHDEQVALFVKMLESVNASVARVAGRGEVPEAVADYLRGQNLPQRVKSGSDPWLAEAPWERQPALEVDHGRAGDADLVGLSRAFGGVAESGTLVLLSGPENPTSLNFLPDTHVICVRAADVAGDYESVWRRLKEIQGKGKMPRTVNMITGPSRSGDIEQTILLGAHGPRRVHVVIVDEA